MRLLLFLLIVTFFAACDRDPVLVSESDKKYTLHAHNTFSSIEARTGIFLSDQEGKVRAFRWLPDQDTARIQVPASSESDVFDCTVVKVTATEVSGSGVRDTSVELTTYTRIPHNETVILRNVSFQQSVRFRITFAEATRVDSVIVPDGLTFMQPKPTNNFTGEYLTLHSGQMWVRALLNGDPLWRFVYFERVSGPALVTTLQSSLMPPIIAKPIKVQLPYAASWAYKVDGVIDTSARRFVPVGDLLRAPGGFVPTFDRIDVFEPNSGDPAVPTPLPYNKGYRLRLEGNRPVGVSYKLYYDRFHERLPSVVQAPVFSTSPTVLADGRSVGVICTPGFDVLAVTHTREGVTRYQWESFVQPEGTLLHRLPDVPEEVSTKYPVLKDYRFDRGVKVRAESYDRLSVFGAIMRTRMLNQDVLWQPKAGYIAKEEVY